MPKFPQFLISTNKKDKPGRLFLLCTKKPGFLGEILIFKSLPEYEKFNANHIKEFLCDVEGKRQIISTHFEYKGKIIGLFIIEFFDVPIKNILDSLLDRTKRWLKAYYLSLT